MSLDDRQTTVDDLLGDVKIVAPSEKCDAVARRLHRVRCSMGRALRINSSKPANRRAVVHRLVDGFSVLRASLQWLKLIEGFGILASSLEHCITDDLE